MDRPCERSTSVESLVEREMGEEQRVSNLGQRRETRYGKTADLLASINDHIGK